jgi:carboxyl-terminal processing protease
VNALLLCGSALLSGIILQTLPSDGASKKPSPSHQELFEAAWKAVDQNFYDPKFAGVDWKAVKERYAPLVDGAKDDEDFRAVMNHMLAELPVSHVSLQSPGPSRNIGIAADIRTIEGKHLVLRTLPGSSAQSEGLRRGDAIDDASWKTMFGSIGTAARLRVRACDGGDRTFEVRREAAYDPRPALAWQIIRSSDSQSTGWLRINHFDESMTGEIDAAMTELCRTNRLLIDVRGNPGGMNTFIRVLSWFGRGERLVGSLLTRRFLADHGEDLVSVDPEKLQHVVGIYKLSAVAAALMMNGAISMYTEDLGGRIFEGKIAVLVDERSGSSAEAFAHYLQYTKRARIVGRRTAGKLLASMTFPLPGDWRITIPIAVPMTPDRNLLRDVPVMPDEEVQWTIADVCEDRDPDVKKALELLRG